jgi:uncharacterized membrane protein
MESISKAEIVKRIIEDVDTELMDEEIIHLVLDKWVSEEMNSKGQQASTLGQRAADGFAKFVGSWIFICGFVAVIFVWVVTNVVMLSQSFDPYPFILLNLVLSCVAAIQAPLILMSQNRQEEKDRMRAENDYKVNLKSEIIMQDIHAKLDLILERQDLLMLSRIDDKDSTSEAKGSTKKTPKKKTP